MANELDDEQMNLLSESLKQNRKIEAIKHYREATGLGLKDSKIAVEKLHAQLRQQRPDLYPAPSQSAGCGSSAALFGLGCGLAYFLWQLPV